MFSEEFPDFLSLSKSLASYMKLDPERKLFYKRKPTDALQRPVWTNGNRIHLFYCDEAIECYQHHTDNEINPNYGRWIMYRGTWASTYPLQPEYKQVIASTDYVDKIPTNGWAFGYGGKERLHDDTMEVRPGEPGIGKF